MEVRPEVIAALGKLVRSGASMEAAPTPRALSAFCAAARRFRDLVEALHSKDDPVMYEALIALQKIRDPSAAPRIAFLLRDLDEKIQIAALETTGILRNRDAAPDVRDALEHARNVKVRRAALTALAMLGRPADHAMFLRYSDDKDDDLRAAAAEGLGASRIRADRPALENAFNNEHKMSPRLSDAFALVYLGNLDTSEFSPLRYLVNTLNSASYRASPCAYLTELARDRSPPGDLSDADRAPPRTRRSS